MTVSYTGDICSTRYWSFLRVIFRWRGSIWKSVLTELCIWLILYYATMYIYRITLEDDGKKTFEFMIRYAGITTDYIPLTFMLGFFVKNVVERWNHMFANIGFVDSVAHAVSATIRGNDLETIIARRNIMRYLCLTQASRSHGILTSCVIGITKFITFIQILILRDISLRVRKRFPTMQSVVKAGIVLPHEEKLIADCVDQMGQSNLQHDNYWIPYNWSCQLCYRMREKGAIASDPVLSYLFRELKEYRERLLKLSNFDLVPIPLAYPQVVFIAVRTYFLICIISRQQLIKITPENEAEIGMLLADQCHNQVPVQHHDSLNTNDIEKVSPSPSHVLIGSAVRLMPRHSQFHCDHESHESDLGGDNITNRASGWKNLQKRILIRKGGNEQNENETSNNLRPTVEEHIF